MIFKQMKQKTQFVVGKCQITMFRFERTTIFESGRTDESEVSDNINMVKISTTYTYS